MTDFKLKPQRYLALDVLRGLTVALMIVVNTPGDWGAIYAPFKHAAWHGFTITDLVFPTFLFVVGNAMSFGMDRLKQAGDTAFLRKILKRTLIIFGIGLFVNFFPFFTYTNNEYVLKNILDIRIWGVLQRIAVCYFLGSLIAYYFSTKGLLVISTAILLIYWGIMYYFGNASDPYSLEGNASIPIDLALLRPENLYHGFGIPFDPEGLISTFPAVVNVTLGFLTGKYIQNAGNKLNTVAKLAAVGVVLIMVAQLWATLFPINKPIWTSTFVLNTVGWDLIIIAVLMLLIEVLAIKKWAYFFEAFGKNPLFIYVLAGVIIKIVVLIRIGGESLKTLIYQNGFQNWLADKNASLLFAICYMLLLWLIGYIMDKKKIYVKV